MTGAVRAGRVDGLPISDRVDVVDQRRATGRVLVDELVTAGLLAEERAAARDPVADASGPRTARPPGHDDLAVAYGGGDRWWPCRRAPLDGHVDVAVGEPLADPVIAGHGRLGVTAFELRALRDLGVELFQAGGEVLAPLEPLVRQSGLPVEHRERVAQPQVADRGLVVVVPRGLGACRAS